MCLEDKSKKTTSQKMQNKQNKLEDKFQKIDRINKHFISLCYGKDICHFIELNAIDSSTQNLKKKKLILNR